MTDSKMVLMPIKNGRNASIELLRIIFMFGICLIHASSNSVFPRNVAQPSVVGFIFISGYYGIRFRLSKILGLYAIAALYCVLSRLFAGDLSLKSALYAWGASWQYWFLHAYVILMAVAPMIEKTFQDRRGLKDALPYLGVIFVWGYSLLFPSLREIIPSPTGLTVTSFMMMLGVYIAARLVRMYKIVCRVPFWVAACCSIALGTLFVFSQFYFCNNLCIASFFFVVMLFSAVAKIKLPSVAQKIIHAIAPSMFGVYIIHGLLVVPGGNVSIGGMMKDVYANFSSWGVITYFISASIVFGCGLFVDIGRRVCLKLVQSIVIKINDYIDGCYLKFVNRLDQLFSVVDKEC